MSKERWFTVAVAAIPIGLSFLLGGPLWGCVFLLIGFVCLARYFFADEQPPTSVLQGISEKDYQELQVAINQRRESGIQLQNTERAELVRILADQMDVVQREQQKGSPSPIIIPEDAWIELYRAHPEDVIREALRIRQARVQRRLGRYSR